MNEVSPKGGGQDARNKKSPLIDKRAFYLIRIYSVLLKFLHFIHWITIINCWFNYTAK